MNKNYTFQAMNVNVVLHNIEKKAALEIEEYVRKFENTASRFKEGNALAFLNQAPLQTPVFIESPIDDLLEKSLYLARATDYFVHPFVGENMKAIGYKESFHERTNHTLNNEKPSQTFQQQPIECLNKNWLIKKQPFTFDFGGFGKGFIVDRIQSLFLANIDACIVNAGGDLYAKGMQCVGIENPIHMGKDMIRCQVKDKALATSSKNYRKWEYDGKKYHHILNGHTGLPANNGVLQASVIAESVMEAETAAKILCILPFEEAKQLLQKNFKKIAYFIYFENNQIIVGGNPTLYKNLEVAS